jgi:diacylglycerol kinase family enzyme
LALAQQAASRRWLARLSLILAAGAVVLLIVFGDLHSLTMLGVGLATAVVSLAAAFWALATRGLRRWLAVALMVLAPAAALAAFALAGLLWVAAVSAAAWLLAWITARAALAPDPAGWRMPEHQPRRRAAHPFLIMNPRSGDGKVERFDLQRKAERLGAEVYLMAGPGQVDVAEVARSALARGADLLGVAGGDGTQALVAGVAASAGVPFVVITAGTRNHFALDLGLDRDDPAACLAALQDGVDLWVDLGTVGGTTFVNNASFGAYAEVVQSAAYRGDKLGATMNQLPDLIAGRRGSRLRVRAGDIRLSDPQAVLVSNNPYGTGDIAGLSRRARLDGGTLALVGVNVASARQAAGLVRGANSAGITVHLVPDVIVDAPAPQIPVGVDGEAMMLATPVHCAVQPRALRVRVPRQRPGVPPPRARMNWPELRQLATPARPRPAAVTPKELVR